MVELAAKYGRVDIPEVKASFRLHQGELTLTRRVEEWCEDSLIMLDLMCGLVPDSRAQLRNEGLRFFSRANYHRASAMSSPLKRLVAYGKVLSYFGYRCLPSFHLLLHILYGTRTYNALRFLKRNLTFVSSKS